LQLDKKFEGLIKGLIATDKKVAEAAQKQTDPRPWSNFTDEVFAQEGQQPESKKETELKDKTFNRDAIIEEYVKKRGDKDAKAKDIAVTKTEGDFMAAFERDKRLQWRSRIRTIAHAFGRRAGNGVDSGPLRKNTADFLTRVYIKSTSPQSGVA